MFSAVWYGSRDGSKTDWFSRFAFGYSILKFFLEYFWSVYFYFYLISFAVPFGVAVITIVKASYISVGCEPVEPSTAI